MKKVKRRNGIHKLLAILLCSLMMITLIPTAAMASEDSCEHHTHDIECGGLNNNCTYICETCVEQVQTLINALPAMQNINKDNRQGVIEQLETIDAAKLGLSDAAMGKVNFLKYDNAAFVLSAPPGWCGLCISKISIAPEGTEITTPSFAFLDENGQPASISYNGANVTSVEVTPNGNCEYMYLPEGTYTVDETVEGEWVLSMSVNGAADEDLTFTGASGDCLLLTVTNTLGNNYQVYNSTGVQYSSASLSDAVENLKPDSQSIKLMANDTINTIGDITIPSGITFEISRGVTLTITDGAGLTIADGAKVTFGAGAKITHSDDYYYRNEKGEKITVEDGEDLDGYITLTKGINLATDGAVLEVNDENLVYNGTAQEPEVTVTYNDTTLTKGTDYEVQYEYNTNATPMQARASQEELPSVTVTGKGNYNGALSANFVIQQKTVSITGIKIKNKVYDGTVQAEFDSYGGIDTPAGADAVYIDTSNIKAAFEDAILGKNKTVKISGYALTGDAAGNYILTEPTSAEASIILTGDETTDKIIEDGMNITDKTVVPEDKETLEKAKDALKDALKDEILTDDQKKAVEDELNRIEDLLESIDKIKDVEDLIEALPDKITEKDKDAVNKAEDAFNKLSEKEKASVNEVLKEKLEDSINALSKLEKDPADDSTPENTTPEDPNAESTPENTTSNDSVTDNIKGTGSPKTGDTNSIAGWIILLSLSFITIIATVICSKMRKNRK